MRRLLFFIIATSILAACIGNGKEHAALNAALTIINDRPDSALAILEDIEYESLGERDKARYGLLFTQAMYRCSRKTDNDTLIDRSITYYQQKGNLADLANSYYYKGCTDYFRGELKGSIRSFKKAEHLIDNCDEVFANKLYERLAYANFHSGCIDLAMDYSKSFLDSSVELADSELIARSLAAVASCYYQLGKKDSAQHAINQYLSELHTMDKELHAEILAYLAQLCFDAGDDHYAELYADSALRIGHQPFAYYVKGLVANRNGDTERAKLFWNRALDTDDEQLKILLNGRIATLKASQKQFEEAYHTKAEEMRLARQWVKKADTERIAELQSQLDAEHSKQRFHQTRSYFVASAVVLVILIVLLWLYHKKKKRDYDSIILDYTHQIDDYVAKLGKDSETIHDYENKLTESDSQIGRLKTKLTILQGRISQLKLAESQNKKEIDSTKKQIAQLRLSIAERLRKGCEIYNAIIAKKSVAHFSDAELENMIEFHKIINFSTFNKWNSQYSNLTVRQLVFLVMTEMGYKDTQMAQVMGVTENAIRTMRSRMKKQYRP